MDDPLNFKEDSLMSADYVIDSLLETVKDAIFDLKSNELKNKIDLQNCSHYFGYLAKLPDDSSIPEECLLCSKVVECIMQLKALPPTLNDQLE
jgi:hypothetical protein